MAEYKSILNPFTGTLQLVPTNTVIAFKAGVANVAALPATGNTLNDGRITADTGFLYVWNGTAWVSQGDVLDVDWSALTSKPSSTVADIDNTVSLVRNNGTENIFLGVNSGNLTLTGARNSALGFKALFSNTTGYDNSAFGNQALCFNTTGYENSAIGLGTLFLNTSGYRNVAVGHLSLFSNSTGYRNCSLGWSSLFANTTGYENCAFGFATLDANTTGFRNNAFGRDALGANTTGSNNCAFGRSCLNVNTTGSQHSAFGNWVLSNNTTGHDNDAFGNSCLFSNTTGNNNSAFGFNAMRDNTTGARNSALGNRAGSSNTTGINNIFIGNSSGYNVLQKVDAINSIAIGYEAYTTADNQIVIGNDSITETKLKGNVGCAGTILGTNLSGINTGDQTADTVATEDSGITVQDALNTLESKSHTQNWDTILRPSVDSGVAVSIQEADGSIMLGFDTENSRIYYRSTVVGDGFQGVTITGGANSPVEWWVGRGDDSSYKFWYWNPSTGYWGELLNLKRVENDNIIYFNGNVGIGTQSPNNLFQVYDLISFSNANYNTSIGYQSAKNDLGQYNTSIGFQSLYNNISGSYNNAFGFMSGFSNIVGTDACYFGFQSGVNDTNSENSFFGSYSGFNTTLGNSNVCIGCQSGYDNTTGFSNVYIGSRSGIGVISGYRNIFIGRNDGQNILQKSDVYNSIAIGLDTYTTKNNQVVIGNENIEETILRGNVETNGELKIKCYSQDTEPVLGADQRLAMWIDTNNNYKVYLVFRRGTMSGLDEQVSVELA